MTPLQTTAPPHTIGSPSKAWLRALELIAPIARNRYGTEARLRQSESYPQAYSPAAAGYNDITHGSG